MSKLTKAKSALERLERALGEAELKNPEGKKYIPIGDLKTILTVDEVETILPACISSLSHDTPESRADTKSLAMRICGDESASSSALQGPPEPFSGLPEQLHGATESFTQSEAVTYRKILAILIMTKTHQHLDTFVNNGMDDSHLPFVVDDETKDRYLLRLDKCHIPLPEINWRDARDILDTVQWYVQAPCFEGVDGIGAPHYQLSGDQPLPTLRHEIHGTRTRVGNFGEVCFAQIHDQHIGQSLFHGPYSFLTSSNFKCQVAIKRIAFSTDNERKIVENEAKVLRRLNKEQHPHIVRLLFTMERMNDMHNSRTFNLFFPVAKGMLGDVWDQNGPFEYGKEKGGGVESVRWVAEQLLGIASGVATLHDMGKRRDVGNAPTGSPDYGAHIDIKPENLLWFTDDWNAAGPPRGTIQLADFGECRFHRSLSRSDIGLTAHSKTYSAPEVELVHFQNILAKGCNLQRLSRSADIWSLGCVFLEFISWVALGKQTKKMDGDLHNDDFFVTTFSINRKKGNFGLPLDKDEVEQDFFYSWKGRARKRPRAVVNPAVVEWARDIERHPHCTQFVLDVVELVMTRMLVVEDKPKTDSKGNKIQPSQPGSNGNGKMRINSQDLTKTLQEFVRKGNAYPGYYTQNVHRSMKSRLMSSLSIRSYPG